MDDQRDRYSDAMALAVRAEFGEFLPALTVEQAVGRFRAVVEFVQTVMKANVDYGVIPGTTKPTLLKPGAEKLCTLFGLSAHFQITERIEDWTGDAYGGEPFFYYLYRCQLLRNELLIAEADGSCNSRETKYRYRKADRVCPYCSQPTIIKGREEYGGGWLCFAKKGGCGAKFRAGDAAIEGQQVGRVPNPDIADQVNTIQKMAQKRALIAAVLIAANASEFFTQDVEDILGVSPEPLVHAPAEAKGEAPAAPGPVAPRRPPISIAQAARFNSAWAEAGLSESDWPRFADQFALRRLEELAAERFDAALDWVGLQASA